jgi:hypothetical protein
MFENRITEQNETQTETSILEEQQEQEILENKELVKEKVNDFSELSLEELNKLMVKKEKQLEVKLDRIKEIEEEIDSIDEELIEIANTMKSKLLEKTKRLSRKRR